MADRLVNANCRPTPFPIASSRVQPPPTSLSSFPSSPRPSPHPFRERYDRCSRLKSKARKMDRSRCTVARSIVNRAPTPPPFRPSAEWHETKTSPRLAAYKITRKSRTAPNCPSRNYEGLRASV